MDYTSQISILNSAVLPTESRYRLSTSKLFFQIFTHILPTPYQLSGNHNNNNNNNNNDTTTSTDDDESSSTTTTTSNEFLHFAKGRELSTRVETNPGDKDFMFAGMDRVRIASAYAYYVDFWSFR